MEECLKNFFLIVLHLYITHPMRIGSDLLLATQATFKAVNFVCVGGFYCRCSHDSVCMRICIVFVCVVIVAFMNFLQYAPNFSLLPLTDRLQTYEHNMFVCFVLCETAENWVSTYSK